MKNSIFIVDDELDIRTLIKDILIDEGYDVCDFGRDKDVLAALEKDVPDLLFLDIWLKGSSMDGIELLEEVKKKHPEVTVIMISGHGNIEMAVSSIKKGAYDFIEKPFNSDKFLLVVERALENSRLRKENKDLRYRNQVMDEIIGVSAKISSLKHVVDKVSQTGSRVLITGPAGVGKEVFARALHNKSDRVNGPFVIFNCAGVNSYSLEQEMDECFSRAVNGTLVLDEICDLPMLLQGKLLKLIQEGQQEARDGARIIAISGQDIPQKIAENLFREDLFYRLNVVTINIPSLAERREDIEVLAEYFIKRNCDAMGVKFMGFSRTAKIALKSYAWPGNVRQLRNAMEWVGIMCPQDAEEMEVDIKHLPIEISNESKSFVTIKDYSYLNDMQLKEARDFFEKEYLQSQLIRFGSISKTASFIGMERTALHRKLKQLGIDYKNK